MSDISRYGVKTPQTGTRTVTELYKQKHGKPSIQSTSSKKKTEAKIKSQSQKKKLSAK